MNREELMDLFSERIRELLVRLPVNYRRSAGDPAAGGKTAADPVWDRRILCDRGRNAFQRGIERLSGRQKRTDGDDGVHCQLFPVCL